METEDELERIRQKKLRQMIERAAKTSDKPVEVNDATLEETIQDNPLVVIDCWAPWCGPCQIVAPVIEELARDYAGKILFGKLNVDENQGVATRYQIMGIPTLLIFKNEKLVDRIVGAMPRPVLEEKMARYLE
ncbi:MAG: thioredoxin [Candidatus Bathyarchaeota archaeon]|nr:MAG: thioredoxin [Candidatus Bathyarchaeota archaeon]